MDQDFTLATTVENSDADMNTFASGAQVCAGPFCVRLAARTSELECLGGVSRKANPTESWLSSAPDW